MKKFIIPLEVVDSSHDSYGSFDIRFGDVSSSFDMSSPCVWPLLLNDNVNSPEYATTFIERNMLLWPKARFFMLKYLNLIGSYRLESLPRDTLVKAFIDNKSSVVNIDIYDLLSEGGRKPSYIQCPENGEGGGLGISIRSDNREAAAEIANKCVGVLEKNKAQIELAWTLLEEYRNKNSSLTRAFKNEHTHIPEIYLQRISLENECDGEAGVRNERISI